ncbi:hypothetical protein Tco_0807082 [Tanacetum coccineum]
MVIATAISNRKVVAIRQDASVVLERLDLWWWCDEGGSEDHTLCLLSAYSLWVETSGKSQVEPIKEKEEKAAEVAATTETKGLMICHKKSSTKGIITSYVLRENNGAEVLSA